MTITIRPEGFASRDEISRKYMVTITGLSTG
jgi:hypothetical protein